MRTSSPRFKSLAVTAGLSFWFFIITTSLTMFSFELFIVFISILFITTQIFAKKISKGLDVFSVINTKIFLGILYVFVISVYGILFRLLRIDLLRLKKQNNSYWLDIDQSKNITRQF